ncbi:hypothetical protein cypCar_00013621 [Cyprinus carpio]|nr:hypothetical protein cypCar_00013621 [Cyprinus carpio]
MANNSVNVLDKQTDDNICATENDDNQPKTPGIPLSRKLCYAVGGMPYQMTATAKGFFMQIFLLDVVKMGAFSASIILFLGRAWDAISDPLIGYAVSKSGRTKIGKLIPWIVFTMPLGVLSYVMLWYTPQDIMSSAFSFGWYFTWCCLFDTFMSCYHVPYSSLNMFLGGNQKDRDSATGYTPLSKLDRINVPYLTGMKMVVRHTPYLWLVFGFLFASLAFQMAQGNFALFCTHAADMGAYFQHLVLILLVRNALFQRVLSMLPDVVDDFKVKDPSCQDLDMSTPATSASTNLEEAWSVGISTLVLHFAGYKSGACKHNPEVIYSLRVLFAPVPICLLLIGMVIFRFYPINEERRRKIQDALRKAGTETGLKGEEELSL